MIDRELLEAAAKAAGYKIQIDRQAERDASGYGHVGLWTEDTSCWNPLTDDGDALRLAVQLRITLHIDGNMTEAEVATTAKGGFFTEPHMNDPYAATRRAIVRAAAEIGRAMP